MTWATVAAITLVSTGAAAQPAATQKLLLEVKPVALLAVSGEPLPMVVNGNGGTVTDLSGHYDIVTNLGTMRITASIDRPMPEGTSLAIRLESSRGVSRGSVDITGATGSADVVTGIGPGSERGQRITYMFSAVAGSNGVDSQSRIVTLTLTE